MRPWWRRQRYARLNIPELLPLFCCVFLFLHPKNHRSQVLQRFYTLKLKVSKYVVPPRVHWLLPSVSSIEKNVLDALQIRLWDDHVICIWITLLNIVFSPTVFIAFGTMLSSSGTRKSLCLNLNPANRLLQSSHYVSDYISRDVCFSHRSA